MLQRLLRSPFTYLTLLVLGSVALRAPVFAYHGPLVKRVFDRYTFRHLGAYTDIASIWFRDHLWRHPLPYFEYRLEYPVLIGWLIYGVCLLASTVTGYLLLFAALLGLTAIGVAALIRRFPSSNVWLFALAPAIITELIVNWDIIGILFLLLALLLYVRGRDAPAGVALAIGVWTKLFPIMLLPVVIVHRASRREWQRLGRGLTTFALLSLAINLPIALTIGHGNLRLRPSWLYFFEFNGGRKPSSGLWTVLAHLHAHLSVPAVNAGSSALVASWAVAVLIATWRSASYAPAERVLPLALLSIVAMFMLANKVYSPQYGLWTIALLAVAGAPLYLALPFLAVDLAYYLASFGAFAVPRYERHAYVVSFLEPASYVRLAVFAALAVWALNRLLLLRDARLAVHPSAASLP